MREGFPHLGDNVGCNCVADNARIEVVGVGEYDATFHGHMGVEVGEAFEDGGRAGVQLFVHAHRTTGEAADLGRLTVDRDPDREATPSRLIESEPGAGFPAVQEMYVNILVTAPDTLPGVTLRNVKTGTLRNEGQDSFPPRNARYELEEPLDLERVDDPGPVVARILSYTANINPE
jgi:hypothetical protein